MQLDLKDLWVAEIVSVFPLNLHSPMGFMSQSSRR